MEIDDALAYYIHDIISSDSDSDSDDTREFDEEYNLLKPPPYDYESIKNKIVIISSQDTSVVLNISQDEFTITDNNNEVKKTKVVSKPAVIKKTENAVQKLNVAQKIEDYFRNKKAKVGTRKVDLSGQASSGTKKSAKTKCSNQSLNTKVKSDYNKSKKKKERKWSTAKIHDSRTVNFCVKMYDKEFPSLDEVYKDKLRGTYKTDKNKSTSRRIVWNKKKKKQFKPLLILKGFNSINYCKYVPKNGYESEVKKNGKRKMKRKLKHSVKVLLNKNQMDKLGIVHITQMASGKTQTKIYIPIYIHQYNY